MTTINTIAGTAGRITGTIARVAQQIDWAEVAAIVLHGLQILIVLALLAGRATRRVWDALPAISERIGKAYARLIIRAPRIVTITIPPVVHPLAEIGAQLEQLTLKELQALAGTRRKVAKRQLVAQLVAA